MKNKTTFSFSNQKGGLNDCMMAQVWDNEGRSLAIIEATEIPEHASQHALLFSKAPQLLEMLNDCIGLLSMLHPPDHLTETYGNLLMNAEQLIKDATTLPNQ